jgi:hydrogenase-4 component J
VEPEIAFYRLSRKIVSTQDNVPEDAQQVVYYSLAIGHHVGVMDCFSELMVVPAAEFRQWLDRLPDGEARRKLEGAFLWNEIEINRSHVDDLLPALAGSLPVSGGPGPQWIQTMSQCLREMVAEPALYMMVKMRE